MNRFVLAAIIAISTSPAFAISRCHTLENGAHYCDPPRPGDQSTPQLREAYVEKYQKALDERDAAMKTPGSTREVETRVAQVAQPRPMPPNAPAQSAPADQAATQISQLRAAINILTQEKNAAENSAVQSSMDNDRLQGQVNQGIARQQALQKELDDMKAAQKDAAAKPVQNAAPAPGPTPITPAPEAPKQ